MEKTEEELLRTVTRTYAQIQRIQAGCCGTTSTQCQILCAVGAEGVLRQATLGERLGLEKSWMSRALDSLEREGLVQRCRKEGDGRSYEITLTPAGQERYRALNGALNAQAAAVMDFIPEEEQSAVRRALKLLAEALRSMQSECRSGAAE